MSVEITDNIAKQEDEAELKRQLQEKDKTLNTLHESLAELNEEQKQCVTLFYLEKKSYQQVMEITGYNMLQVKSYIQNGKRNLKLVLEKILKNNNG